MRLKWHDKGKIVAGGVEAQATLRRVPRRERRRDKHTLERLKKSKIKD